MVAILFNGLEPFEQTVNISSTEGPMWNLVKIGQVVSEKTAFKDYTILFIYIAQDCFFFVLGFNDTSTLVGHFVSSPRERERRDRRDSRGDERDD